MIGTNAIIALVVLAFTSILFFGNITDIREANGATQAARIIGDIAGANVELSLERSITQVALHLDEPINADLEKMLSEQRIKSSSSFAHARQMILDSTSLEDRQKYADRLDGYLKALADLRVDADRYMRLAIAAQPT
jgi:hypothetical protein